MLPEKKYDEILQIKNEVESDLLKLPGVIGVDVGYKYVKGKKTNILAIRVFVEKKAHVEEKQEIPKHIQGVPTDVIQRRFTIR